jgi:hypothetical protein
MRARYEARIAVLDRENEIATKRAEALLGELAGKAS